VIEDVFAVDRALDAPGPLRAFNDAGILGAADVHVARRLAAVGGEADDAVLLAVALAVRAPRVGDVYADLDTIHATAAPRAEAAPVGGDAAPVEAATLHWPAAGEWRERVARSPLVAVGEDDGDDARPLRLVGPALYLDRYWRDERQIASDLQAFAAELAAGVDAGLLADGLRRLFGEAGDERQQLAAASAVLRRFAVVAGGPGTGKTTTVARIVALLAEQSEALLVGLAAPTAKAAARLGEAIRDEAERMEVAPEVAERLRGLQALTLHRLLGYRRDSQSRFRHHRANRLPYDVVVVDETSMVSLTMMARLLEAVRADARIVLVGDPGQLAAIDNGAVLADIVGPATSGPRMRAPARAALAEVGLHLPAGDDAEGSAIGDGIVVLDHVFRFGAGIAKLADAVRRGDAGAALAVLEAGAEGVTWIRPEGDLAPIREAAVATARAVHGAAAGGDAAAAIEALGRFRLLCAHRRGDHGVAAWTAHVEGWLEERLAGFRTDVPWYVGRPLLVTENDYGLRLFNGDTGVVVATQAGGVEAAFLRQGGVATYHPSRLAAIDTVYAMTIHKSQGSQFDTAAVVLPDPSSQILSRELLYTAATRAKERLIVFGGEAAVRAAVERPVARASGLRGRLWT
jgi:exodeoxyribonuclease V alpha subunit